MAQVPPHPLMASAYGAGMATASGGWLSGTKRRQAHHVSGDECNLGGGSCRVWTTVHAGEGHAPPPETRMEFERRRRAAALTQRVQVMHACMLGVHFKQGGLRSMHRVHMHAVAVHDQTS